MMFTLQEAKLRFMKGLSPLVSMVLVIAFGFTAMTIVLAVVNPLLDRAKDSGIVNEAMQNMQLLDSAIKAVASEAKGSKRTMHIKITEGVLRTDISTEHLFLEYEPRTRYILDGFSGDIKIESRPVFLEYFNWYGDNDNANETWTINGTWSVSSGRYLGTGGIAFRNIGNQSGFDLAATVVRSADPNGQVYVVSGDPRDLVLYLPFDGNVNSTISTAYDYSGYKNNGTLLNATSATCASNNACATWIIGRFGNSTDYDGIGDLTNITGVGSFNSTSFTVAIWVNPNSTRTQGIIAKTSTPTNQRWRIFMTGTGGVIEFDTQPTELGNVQSTTNLARGTWYHVVAAYDGTNARIYVNGALESTASASTMFNNNTNHIEIAPSETNRFNGTIDEVMLFNRALTSDEIAFLYESSIEKITTGGEIPTIGRNANATIVLAAPVSTYFDNIKVKAGDVKIRFVVPYQNIDIVNASRFGPGDHNIVINHYGTNTTVNKPMIGLEE